MRRLLVGAALSYALALAAFSGTSSVMPAAAALGGGALLIVWMGSRLTTSPRARQLASGLDIVATNLALALVLGEAALRMYATRSDSVLVARDTITPYRLKPRHDYGRLWTNAAGYASREFSLARAPGVTRVALLGDSFAVGSVRQDMNFASVLERLRTDVEVYNFGISAIGPKDYRLILETEALALEPDIVLVALFVGNDLSEEFAAPGQRTLDDYLLYRFSWRVWRMGREWIRLRVLPPPAPLHLPQLAHPPLPERGFNLSRRTYLEIELERLAVSRASLRAALEPGWRLALGHLRAMRDASARRGIVFAIAIIPDEFQVNPDLLDELLALGSVPGDDVDLVLPQRRLLDFCRAEGIPCLDLLPALAGRRDAYLPDDTHWNETGNRIAAEALAGWMDSLRRDLLPASQLGRVENPAPLRTR